MIAIHNMITFGDNNFRQWFAETLFGGCRRVGGVLLQHLIQWDQLIREVVGAKVRLWRWRRTRIVVLLLLIARGKRRQRRIGRRRIRSINGILQMIAEHVPLLGGLHRAGGTQILNQTIVFIIRTESILKQHLRLLLLLLLMSHQMFVFIIFGIQLRMQALIELILLNQWRIVISRCRMRSIRLDRSARIVLWRQQWQLLDSVDQAGRAWRNRGRRRHHWPWRCTNRWHLLLPELVH